jgi:hypothetical protein
MTLPSFSLRQLLIAVFWLACAFGSYTTADSILKISHEGLPFLAVVTLLFVGMPCFFGLAAGSLLGHQWGCLVTVIAFGFCLLVPFFVRPLEAIIVALFVVGVFALIKERMIPPSETNVESAPKEVGSELERALEIGFSESS